MALIAHQAEASCVSKKMTLRISNCFTHLLNIKVHGFPGCATAIAKILSGPGPYKTVASAEASKSSVAGRLIFFFRCCVWLI